MKYIPILTAQNVQIQATLASVGERLMAFLIDLGVKLLYMYGLVWLGVSDEISEVYSDSWSVMATWIVINSPVVFYTLYSETLSGGYTIGKKIMKLKVISLDSYKTRTEQYFIRWMFNLIDVFTFFGGIGLMSSIVSGKNQRIGDLAAGTTVVKISQGVTINDSIFVEVEEGYKVTFPMVTLLSDRDVQIIKSSYTKAKANSDYKTIGLIRSKIDSVLNVPSKLNDQLFIERVIEDYNFVTKDLT